MVVEEFPNITEWLFGSGKLLQSAVIWFVIIAFLAALLGTIVGYVIAMFRHGPFEAFYVVAGVIYQAVPDLCFISPRRVYAIAKLAAKEAFRRRVIIVAFGIFAIALLFGGWFLNSGTTHPERVIIGFVMFGTQLLVLMLGVLVSAFSLPEDIANKTIYTVVTKPVRSSEIILGRILGFVFLGTILLVAMGLVSYFFVWRALSHTHELAGDAQNEAAFVAVDQDETGRRSSQNAIKQARTTNNSGHSHLVELVKFVYSKDAPELADDANVLRREETENEIIYYRVIVEPFGSHTHDAFVEGEGENAKITFGPEKGFFRSRKPLYASKLQFYDRSGQAKEKGINIGRVWEYRGYIEGGSDGRPSLSKAVFEFDDVKRSRFTDPDQVIMELTLQAFRTAKGVITKRIMGSYQFESIPDPNDPNPKRFRSVPISFESDEFNVQVIQIPELIDGDLLGIDEESTIESGQYSFFDDYAANGRVRLILRCHQANQYLGVAQADIYFRTGDSPFWINFAMGYVGIWLQLIIVVSLGVVFSTFLGSPVTIIGIVTVVVLGFFSEFVAELSQYNVEGGGAIQSAVRLANQKAMTVKLGNETAEHALRSVDSVIGTAIYSITWAIPDLRSMDFSDYVQYGYRVDFHRVVVSVISTLVFSIGIMIFGYFCLKTREIAK